MTGRPRISVVVPVYNVEQYLEECLDSIAAQTVSDLEVVMVDDGSTDGSAAIAEAYAAGDPRFKLLRQANAGLSAARNTGIDAATGEYLAFVDSDDALPPEAYERLLGALTETGSDFASGNVLRMRRGTYRTSPFLAKTFRQTRLRTHVTRFQLLLADRTAWNKLFKRSFWDANELRFPEGVVHEDIPVMLPAHFLAKSVDVISEPVYHYRIRESGDLSITQQRLEKKVLLDRLAAVERVSDFLGKRGRGKDQRWYDASVVANDLRYYLDVLENADEDYRQTFLDRVNAYLDRVHGSTFSKLPAIQRLKWHLVRRRMMPELLEVLRFERDDLRRSAPIRIRGRWYGDYPFRTDRSKRIPLATYRLKQELGLEAGIEELELDGERLRIAGYAYVERVGAPTPRYQHVSVVAVAPGRLRSVRSRLSVARARARGSERRDVTARSRNPIADPTFSGFEAALDLRRLRARRGRDGRFELFVVVRVGRIVRRRVRFELSGAHPARAVERLRGDGTLVRAVPGVNGDVAIELARAWVRIAGYRVEGETVVLSGMLHGLGGKPKLEAARGDETPVRHALKVDGDAFTATIPLAALEPEFDGDGEPLPPWRLSIARGARPVPVTFAEEAAGGSTPHGEREVALVANRQGQATLALRAPRLVLDAAAWSEGDVLEVAAPAPQGPGPHELVLQDRARLDEYVVPLEDAGAGRVRARLTPGRVATLAGTLGLREGAWELHTRGGDGRLVPVVTAPELDGAFPCGRVIDHKPFELRRRADRRAVLRVDRDLDEDERGSFHEHRMRREIYRGRRGEPLREAVMYSSFHGRQYSDSPRAIHEELVRRGAPLEHLWVVRDGRCVVPDTATALREGSSEFYDALARSRYVVYNDHFPDWFRRRVDQVCLQTWHGVPLKRLGFDASEQQRSIRKFEREWTDQLPNWQYVVSPNRFSTPHLRRAYSLDGELIETGYPRDDIFARDGLAERSRAVRERLGIPEGVRTVLYAPTYRDHVVDQRGRYRLDLRLDVDRLRAAVGPDTVILLRKHHYIVDALPVSDDGLVRDVSEFPDGTEIMLAADVLITDYSSMMFDFANTGRPILFFTYDLSVYRDEVRGFYFDLVERAPGPLLETTDEIAEALRDLPALEAANRDRYASFTAEFCELDDGHASARVVDRVFDL